jgi:hypothetical protein
MRWIGVAGVVVLAVVLLSSCAPGPNALANSASDDGVVAGFWRGWWNGFISPVTFVISLFNPKVQIYEVHNNGGWYNFGFILGAMAIFGGGAGGGAHARRGRSQKPGS